MSSRTPPQAARILTSSDVTMNVSKDPSCSPGPSQPPAKIANPASQHCIDQGGELEIRTGPDGGEYGVCRFANGSECEEWAFQRGQCQPK